MKIINQETGRSMVEMLGVLAIIGVLSIGGIAGYQHAMNRHKANEWLNNYNQFRVQEIVARERAMQNLDEDGMNIDYSFESNGFIARGLYNEDLGEFYSPPLHNAQVCKMVFEQVNPYEELGVVAGYSYIGDQNILECWWKSDVKSCLFNACEKADFDSDMGWSGVVITA